MKFSSLVWGIGKVENWFETALFAQGRLSGREHTLRFRDGMRLTLRRNDMEFLAELIKRDCYRLRSGFLPEPGSVIIDVGANIGIFTVLAARSGARQVYAIEPEMENLALLRRNVSQNSLSNVTIIDKAIGPEPGRAVLHLQADGSGSHTIRRTPHDVRYSEKRQTVEVITMEDLVGRAGKVGLLKFDAEGIEHEVFARMDGRVSGKISAIVMECHERGDADENTLSRDLEGLGFSVSLQKIDGRHSYVFAKKQKPI